MVRLLDVRVGGWRNEIGAKILDDIFGTGLSVK